MGADTGHGSTWLTWRGTHPYETITALAGNFVMKQEEEHDPCLGLECGLATGRGVATTQCWNVAIRDAIPIILEGVRVQAKMVLLAMAPGDSKQELGTMFSLDDRWSNLQKRQVIPTKEFEEEMFEMLPDEAIQEGLFRHLRMADLEFRPPSLVQRVRDHGFKPYPKLQQRTNKAHMQQKAHAGHVGEGAWTNTDSVGLGIASSMVHIVGVAVMYYGKASSKYTASKRKKHEVFHGFDMMSVPCWARPLKAPSEHDDS